MSPPKAISGKTIAMKNGSGFYFQGFIAGARFEPKTTLGIRSLGL